VIRGFATGETGNEIRTTESGRKEKAALAKVFLVMDSSGSAKHLRRVVALYLPCCIP